MDLLFTGLTTSKRFKSPGKTSTTVDLKGTAQSRPGGRQTFRKIIKYPCCQSINTVRPRTGLVAFSYFFYLRLPTFSHILLTSLNDIMFQNTKILHPPHPFYPLEAEIVGYLANQWDVPTLLGIFLVGCIVILGLTHVLATRVRPGLSGVDKSILLWFVLSMLLITFCCEVVD